MTTFAARYLGKCRLCAKTIRVGELVTHLGTSRKPVHVLCVEGVTPRATRAAGGRATFRTGKRS